VGYLSGAGSDYAAFVHYLGITSMDIAYTYDRVRPRKKQHELTFSQSDLSYFVLPCFHVNQKAEQSEAIQVIFPRSIGQSFPLEVQHEPRWVWREGFLKL